MKHKFLLNEMLIYPAVKGVGEKDYPDSTAAELVRLIGENCHTLVAHRVLRTGIRTMSTNSLRDPHGFIKRQAFSRKLS